MAQFKFRQDPWTVQEIIWYGSAREGDIEAMVHLIAGRIQDPILTRQHLLDMPFHLFDQVAAAFCTDTPSLSLTEDLLTSGLRIENWTPGPKESRH